MECRGNSIMNQSYPRNWELSREARLKEVRGHCKKLGGEGSAMLTRLPHLETPNLM